MLTSINPLLSEDELKPEIVSALKNLLFTEAFLDVLTPDYERICQEALNRFLPVVEDRPQYRGSARFKGMVGSTITQFTHLYQASDETAKAIYIWHKAQMALCGHVVEGEGRCPYLVAQSTKIQAEQVLIEVMASYTGIRAQMLTKTENRKQYLNILSRMLVTLATEQGLELNLIKEQW